MKPKKIFFLTDGLDIGGAEIVFIRLLNELHKEDIDLVVFSIRSIATSTHVEIPNFPIIYLSSNRFISCIYFLKTCFFCKPDTVVSSMKFANFINSICAWLVGYKCIWWVHNTNEGILSFMKKIFAKRADVVFCASKTICGLYKKFHKNAVFVANLTPQFTAKKKLDIKLKPSEKIRLISVFSLTKQKNPKFHLDIIKNILAINPQIDLIYEIYGDGPLRKEIQNEVIKSGLVNYVKIMGNYSDVIMRMHYYDLLLHFPLWEGYGMVIIEAIATRLPYITFNFEGPSEIYKKFNGGTIIENTNSSEQCAKNVISCFDKKPVYKDIEYIFERENHQSVKTWISMML